MKRTLRATQMKQEGFKESLFSEFDKEFNLTNLRFAYQSAQMGVDAPHAAIALTWHHSHNTMLGHAGCTLKVNAQGIQSRNQNSLTWAARATIEWWTGSQHYVKFEFQNEEKYAPLELKKVCIGNDESHTFYGIIRELCKKSGVPFEEHQRVERPDTYEIAS